MYMWCYLWTSMKCLYEICTSLKWVKLKKFSKDIILSIRFDAAHHLKKMIWMPDKQGKIQKLGLKFVHLDNYFWDSGKKSQTCYRHVFICEYLIYGTSLNYRIESHGKGILKPHQLLAEFEAFSKEEKFKLEDGAGAFAEILKSTQVGV